MRPKKRRYPKGPPPPTPTRADQPWLYKRDVAPDMNKPMLKGETRVEFLSRCYDEDERFTIDRGLPVIIAGAPEMDPYWKKRNAEKRKKGYRFSK